MCCIMRRMGEQLFIHTTAAKLVFQLRENHAHLDNDAWQKSYDYVSQKSASLPHHLQPNPDNACAGVPPHPQVHDTFQVKGVTLSQECDILAHAAYALPYE